MKRKKRFLILGIFFVLGMLSMALAKVEKGSDGMDPRPVMVGIFAVLACVMFWLFLGSNKHKEGWAKIRKGPLSLKERLSLMGALVAFSGRHVDGLPVVEGLACDVFLKEDGFVFESSSDVVNLPMDKISAVDLLTDEQIERFVASSVGGAVAGGLILGPLGMIIGGRAKIHKVKSRRYFFFGAL